MNEISAIVDEGHHGLRVDRYVSDVLGVCSRSQLKQREVEVSINGKPAKLSRQVKGGDSLTVRYSPPEPSAIEPEPVTLDILYEDNDVIVINKPAGMVVHPAQGNRHGTLMQGLLYYVAGLQSAYDAHALADRPGIVHRLDKDTSGVIVTAKSPAAHEFLAKQFRLRRTVKIYLAVVKGGPRSRVGNVEATLSRDPDNRKRFAVTAGKGKPSLTRYRVLARNQEHALLRLRPETGRTHQLRVHMKHIGCPILGDPLYSRQGGASSNTGLMLHAFRLTIEIPDGSTHTFTAPLPERFMDFLSVAFPDVLSGGKLDAAEE